MREREILSKQLATETKIEVGGLKINYYLSRNEGVSRTLVFIHGYSSNHCYFVTLFSRLFSDLGYNLLAFSLPGHGKSELPTGSSFGFKEQVELSRELVMRLAAGDDIYLHGHSMGGGIALALSTLPELKIKDVVVVSPLNRTSISRQIILNRYYLPLTFKDARKLISLIYHQGGSYIKGYNSLTSLKEDLHWIWSNPAKTAYLGKLLKDLLRSQTMDTIDSGIRSLGGRLTMFFGTSDGIIDLLNIVDYFLELNPATKIYPRPQTGHTPWIEDASFYRNWLERHYSRF